MRISFNLLLTLVVIIGLGIGAGVAAFQANSSAAKAAPVIGMPATVPSNPGNQGQGPSPTAGIVDTVGDNQFTLNIATSSNPVTVRVNDQTTLRRQAAGAISDIKPGDRIMVRGEAGADGSIAAASIQLNPGNATGTTPQSRPSGQFRVQPGQAAGSQGQEGMSEQIRTQSGPPGAQSQGAASGESRRQSGQPGQPGNQSQVGSAGVFGVVQSVDNDVISVTPTGSAEQTAPAKVTVSDRTSISRTDSASFEDITPGANVVVVGPKGADGVIVASSVQISTTGSGGTQEQR